MVRCAVQRMTSPPRVPLGRPLCLTSVNARPSVTMKRIAPADQLRQRCSSRSSGRPMSSVFVKRLDADFATRLCAVHAS